jgi:hypothetical protein
MGRVAAFALAGVECWFYSQDHRPPHFHARRRGQWHVRVYFLEAKARMLERVAGPRGVLSAADRSALCDVAELYREELLLEWEQKVVCDG